MLLLIVNYLKIIILDIEDLYENYGWKVTYNKSAYNKSAYNEESSSTFTFEKLV